MSKTEAETEAPDEGARSFARLVATLSDGDCERETSLALQKLVGAIRLESKRTNRKVKAAINLAISLEYKGDAVTVGYTLKVKEPTPERGESMFFVTPGGNLTREVPKQENLPFRVVDNTEKPETRDAPAGATEARGV
jgi:hypothetical protein